MLIPNIVTTRKAHWSPTEHDRRLTAAARMAARCDVPLPVFYDRRPLGWMAGDNRGGVRWVPLDCAQPTSRADVFSALTNGRFYHMTWARKTGSPLAANALMDLWPLDGLTPGGSLSNTARTATACNSTTTGALPTGGDVAPRTKHITAISVGNTNSLNPNPATLILYDRLLVYDQCGIANVQQSMTNTTALARYNTEDWTGARIIAGIGGTGTGATTATLTELTYSNQDGNPSTVPTTPSILHRTSAAAASTAVASRIFMPCSTATTEAWNFYMPMQAGDTGVRSIASYTFSANNSGAFTFALIFPLAICLTNNANVLYSTTEWVQNLPDLPRVYDGACLNFIGEQTTNVGGPLYNGHVDMIWC